MHKLRTSIATLLFAALSISGFSQVTSASPPGRMGLPVPTGPFGVGRVSYALTDTGRSEPLSETPGAHRRMMVYVWYPTDRRSVAGKDTAPYLPGFDEVLPRLTAGDVKGMFRPSVFRGIDLLPQTDVVEDAPIASGKEPFPLLLFSHGWGNPTFLYTAELEDVVSHGYIVLAIDHPYDTTYTRFPDGDVVHFAQSRFDTETKKPHGFVDYAVERVRIMGEDNRFALTEILRYDSAPDLHAPFYHRIDVGKIGALGHSIGGLAAARTCQIDARVRACVDQDSDDDRGSPFVVTPLDQTENQPFLLFVVASADQWSPATVNPSDASLAEQKLTREAYMALLKRNQETETKQLAGIPGGSFRVMLFGLPGFIHRSFTDQTLLDFSTDKQSDNMHNFAVAQAYTLAFFDKTLKKKRHTILDSTTPIDPRAKVDRFSAH